MKKACIIVLDSMGVGATVDAHLYGDEGANTLGNLARAESLRLPHPQCLGLAHIPAAT